MVHDSGMCCCGSTTPAGKVLVGERALLGRAADVVLLLQRQVRRPLRGLLLQRQEFLPRDRHRSPSCFDYSCYSDCCKLRYSTHRCRITPHKRQSRTPREPIEPKALRLGQMQMFSLINAGAVLWLTTTLYFISFISERSVNSRRTV